MKRAVFLDRDGCLIEEVEYLSTIADIKLIEGAAKALLELKKAGFLIILLTNQSGVARGYFTESFVQKAHGALQAMLHKEGVMLDAIYYCPHHVKGNAPYNIDCECRKPKLGMLKAAQKELAAKKIELDLENSFMIGDKLADVELGYTGLQEGVLVQTGHGKSETGKVLDQYPDTHIAPSIVEAISYLLSK